MIISQFWLSPLGTKGEVEVWVVHHGMQQGTQQEASKGIRLQSDGSRRISSVNA